MRGDDGAGLAAIHAWQQTYPRTAERHDIRIELEELPGIGLLSLMEGADAAIIVDAVMTHNRPGQIHLLDENQLAGFATDAGSAHGFGVAETLALGRRVDPEVLPREVFLIGIEIKSVEMGAPLSPEIIQAIPSVADLIELHVQRLSQI